jgi:DNA invertase Pin-like site-specific DNA recombinase
MQTATPSRRRKTQSHILTLPPIGSEPPKDAANTVVRYCLYARKSSEEIERQALSIDSQIKEMLTVAQRDSLHIVEIRKESHSAKSSGSRPVFNQLLKDVRNGIFNGILTWDPSRLSRNAGDIGSVIDLMDQGHLAHIRTHSQKFTNNPNEKFLLMILSSQAKLENDNRGINVKRGQKTRAEMGYRPCLTPLGYLQERRAGENRSRVVMDPVRGPIVRQMFEHVAVNGASGRVILRWMKEIGFTTRKGKLPTLSMIYRMLHSHFYLAKFEYPQGSGKWYRGDYEPLVSEKLFKDVQKVLDMAPKKEWGYKDFHFVRMMICGGCGSGITAEEKVKYRKNGTSTKYVYYRCTKSRNLHCKEASIREDVLVEQLMTLIDTIDLDESGMRAKLEEEVKRYCRFTQGVLGQDPAGDPTLPKVDARSYAKYILKDGTKDERRQLLGCLKDKLTLKDGSVSRMIESVTPQVAAQATSELKE